jgi:hypothetical protein
MIEPTRTDRARRLTRRPAKRGPQASTALRNPVEAMNLFFSPGFSAAC